MEWTALSEGLWTLEKRQDGVCTLRSVAVRLADGSVAVVGPMRAASPEKRAELGHVSFLLAPNHFHHLGLQAWSTDGATAVASDGARPRLARWTPVDVGGLDALRERLPPHVSLVTPPGLKNGEIWVVAGDTWVVGDAFFNIPRIPWRSRDGWMYWLLGVGTGLKIGPTFKVVGIGDAKVYYDWLRGRLAEAPPARLLPSHGDVAEGAAERLRAIVSP